MKFPKYSSQETIYGIKVQALFEIFVFLAFVLFVAYITGNNNRFFNFSPHPFWAIVLLTTVQYGTNEGLLAAFIATIVLYAGNLPPQNADQSLFDYQLNLALLPFFWFATAFILGEMRTAQERSKQKLISDCQKYKDEGETIAKAYQVLKETKENLEINLTSQIQTAAAAYNGFKSLGNLEPAQIIFGLNDVIKSSLNPDKFSVFAYGPNGFEAATSSGWGEKDTFIRRFKTDTPLYDAIAKQRKTVCIVNRQDEKTLGDEGVLAAPLIDQDSGDLFGMLKIEKLDLMDLDLSRIQTFKTVCGLIGTAYANAKAYQKMSKTSIYAPNLSLYSHDFFLSEVTYLKQLAENLSFPLTKVTLHLKEGTTQNYIEAISNALPPQARLYSGIHPHKQLIVLIPLKTVAVENAVIPMIEEALSGHLLKAEALTIV